MAVRIRPADAADGGFLAAMLVEAFFWRPDRPAGDVQSVLARPEVAHYVTGRPRPGDLGVVAEAGPPVGAAWLRFLPENDRGYGFVDEGTPELTIGVAPTHRGRGIGSSLLSALVLMAREQHHARLSLSVEPDDPARRLYERCGFKVVGTNDGSLTMLLLRRDGGTAASADPPGAT